jgi:hypothetical protein
VAEAELPPDEALSALSDPQAPASSVNAATSAINQRSRKFIVLFPPKATSG